MNCDHITERLAEGEALDPAAMEHVAGCASCRGLLSSLETAEKPAPELDPEFLASVRQRLGTKIEAVTPLPSDGVMIGRLAVGSVVFIVLSAFAVHMLAPRILSPLQMVLYYGAILITVVMGASVITGEMIPGSRLRAQGRLWSVITAVGLTAVCVISFRSYDTERFLRLGVPCLGIGSGAALVAGMLLSFYVRRGFVAFERTAARRIGLFAGLSGVAVLALHCPWLSVSHIVVWHFGVLLLGWVIGDLGGRILEAR